MNSSNLNPRMTIVVVFAFLFIVALFISPGGTADRTTETLATVARTAATKRTAAAPAPVPSSWLADSAVEPPLASPSPAMAEPPPAQPDGGAATVIVDRPPQGPDFPENR